MSEDLMQLWSMLGLRYKSHPWHGIQIGEQAPAIVPAFIEIIPTDTVKYEIDKSSGYLKIDRPQKFSNIVPALYGFIPQTYCKEHLARLCMEKTQRTGIVGDNDPLDICVLTSREITHGDIIVRAVPVGGFRLIDNNEADDKILAVLVGDDVYGSLTDIHQVPEAVVNRLKHYFLTYKQLPDDTIHCEITHIYGREEAHAAIEATRMDYQHHFGNITERMSMLLRKWMKAPGETG